MDDPQSLLLLAAGLLIVCALCLWGNARQLRRRRLLHDTPTSKVRGVFIGLVELRGTAESAAPLTSFLAGKPCVHHAWSIDEHWSRTVTETYRDSAGKTKTRTRRESGWKTVASGGASIPFFLRDDTGVILVRPDGAKIEPATLFEETVSRGHPLYYAKGPAHSVSHSDHRRRFVERGIVLHADLFVVGTARERPDVVAPEIAADPASSLFLISTRSEEKVRAGMGGWAWFWGVLGALVAITPLAVVLFDKSRPPPTSRVIAYAAAPLALYAAAWATAWVWMVFNSLVHLRQRVRQAWSLIDVQLKRRHDLIPRLAAIVDGLGGHEREVQTALAALRAQMSATPPGVSGPDFAGLTASVRAVAEAYPNLTADAAFRSLHTELVETEQRIALARAYYNDIATRLATRLERIPDRWVGALAAMKPEPLLVAADFERAAVRVEPAG